MVLSDSKMDENKIVIYQTEDGQTQIDVRLENETVWLTQAQMAELFETDRTSIVRHINNIYRVDELGREATCAKIAQVQTEGKRQVTNERIRKEQIGELRQLVGMLGRTI